MCFQVIFRGVFSSNFPTNFPKIFSELVDLSIIHVYRLLLKEKEFKVFDKMTTNMIFLSNSTILLFKITRFLCNNLCKITGAVLLENTSLLESEN